MVSKLAEKKLKVRNRNVLKLEQIDLRLDELFRHGYEPGDANVDGLLYDRTILFDVLVAQGCAPWEYRERSWLKK